METAVCGYLFFATVKKKYIGLKGRKMNMFFFANKYVFEASKL